MISTQEYSEKIKKLKCAIEDSDAILIGAGAGLSTSAGYLYTGSRFRENFGDFEKKYGFHDMYSGGFYPYKTSEEKWGFWSRYVMINRYADAPKKVYSDLLDLVKDKNYFVLTTNVDHCFQKEGFDKSRLFYTQGDYGLFQCSLPCHDKTYDNEAQIKEMYKRQKEGKIPSELIPHCPVCGREMSMNLRADDTFVQDEGWYLASARYSDFLQKYKNGKILLWELGVGGNTPGIIKYPFWRMAYANQKATYCSVNYGEALAPKEIEAQSILFDEDIGKLLKDLISF